jgi:hypothetical protein
MIFDRATMMLVLCFILKGVTSEMLNFWCCFDGVSVAVTKDFIAVARLFILYFFFFIMCIRNANMV